jgi:hypothetical protein
LDYGFGRESGGRTSGWQLACDDVGVLLRYAVMVSEKEDVGLDLLDEVGDDGVGVHGGEP